MNKILIALFVVGFWLFLPIPLMYIGIGGFDTLTINESSTVLDFVRIYFNVFAFNIPDLHLILRLFFNILQFLSLVVIVFVVSNQNN